MNKGVFLDRDGVLNKAIVRNGKPFPPANDKEFEVLEGVEEALILLRNSNFKIIVVTNQPDLSRGKITLEQVNHFHSILQEKLNIHDFYICPHDDFHECLCRKPKPGLITKSALENKVDLSNSYLVGDRWRDIEAGQSAGCKCFYISSGYKERLPLEPYLEVQSLLEASKIILEME